MLLIFLHVVVLSLLRVSFNRNAYGCRNNIFTFPFTGNGPSLCTWTSSIEGPTASYPGAKELLRSGALLRAGVRPGLAGESDTGRGTFSYDTAFFFFLRRTGSIYLLFNASSIDIS